MFSRAKLGFMEIYSLLIYSAGGFIQEEHRLGFTPRSQFASGFKFSPGGLGRACASFTKKEWDPDP